LVSLILLGICVGCVEPPASKNQNVPVSEKTMASSNKVAEVQGATEHLPPEGKVQFEVPCSEYPVAGERGPYRLASASDIEPPRRNRFEERDVRTLGLEKSDVPGPVILEVLISETGAVTSVVVVRPAHPDFDKQAVEALRAAVYEPAIRGGKPVSVCIAVTVTPHP
jgi:TonB family protein